jgi:hypothetical protein
MGAPEEDRPSPGARGTRPRGRTGALGAALALAPALAFVVSAGDGSAPDEDLRSAPMVAGEASSPSGIVLGDPRILDLPPAWDSPRAREPDAPLREIRGFRFLVDAGGPESGSATAVLEVQTPSRTTHTFTVPIATVREGDDLHVPARIPVPQGDEGSFAARLTLLAADGEPLFVEAYTFGYPRYDDTRDLRKVRTSADLRDDSGLSP